VAAVLEQAGNFGNAVTLAQPTIAGSRLIVMRTGTQGTSAVMTPGDIPMTQIDTLGLPNSAGVPNSRYITLYEAINIPAGITGVTLLPATYVANVAEWSGIPNGSMMGNRQEYVSGAAENGMALASPVATVASESLLLSCLTYQSTTSGADLVAVAPWLESSTRQSGVNSAEMDYIIGAPPGSQPLSCTWAGSVGRGGMIAWSLDTSPRASLVQDISGLQNEPRLNAVSTAGNLLIFETIGQGVVTSVNVTGVAAGSGPFPMEKIHLQKYGNSNEYEASVWALYDCPAGLDLFTPNLFNNNLMVASEWAGVPINFRPLSYGGAKGQGVGNAEATLQVRNLGSFCVGVMGSNVQASGSGSGNNPWVAHQGNGANNKTIGASRIDYAAVGDAVWTTVYTASAGRWGICLVELGLSEPPPEIVTVIPPQSDEVGVAIAPLNAAGYFSGTVVSYTALNLPSGLTIDTSSGVITGTPDTVNTYSTTVVATNAGGPTNNGPFAWDIVGVAPVWTTVPDQISIEGSGVSVNFAPYVIDGSPPITFTASGGNPLPTGLVISSAGQVTGVPTVVGVFPVVLVATNAFGAVNSSAFNWTINSAAPDAPILDLPNAANFAESAGPETWDLSSYNIGAPATSWSTSGGPPGTTIDNAGVMTTDLTTAQGVWAVFVTAANAMGSYSDTLALNVTSSDPVVAQQPPVRFNTIGDSANVNMAAYISGATSWSATGLPIGTSINPTSGLITGTIGGTPQTYNPVITGTNIHGFITTTFQWTVQPVPVVGNKRYGRV
jgi:hypothetical protein